MEGMLLIPDISGFTGFVEQTDPLAGVKIIRDLLNVIIESNRLPMELSEIEGDAILFYKTGSPIPMKDLFEATSKIDHEFSERFNQLKLTYNINVNLTLKFIVHFGELNVYSLRGFKKLYGKSVIECHHLLKNGHGINNYILVTDDYIKALAVTSQEYYELKPSNFLARYTKFIGGFRKMAYSFFNLTPLAPQILLQSNARFVAGAGEKI